MIFIGSSGYEFYKNIILPSESEDGSFGFLIYASSDENAMLAWAFEEHRDSETKHTERVLSRLGRDPELWIGANGTSGSKFAILAVLKDRVSYGIFFDRCK